MICYPGAIAWNLGGFLQNLVRDSPSGLTSFWSLTSSRSRGGSPGRSTPSFEVLQLRGLRADHVVRLLLRYSW